MKYILICSSSVNLKNLKCTRINKKERYCLLMDNSQFINEYVKHNENSYKVMRVFLKPLAYFLYWPKIYGKENVPVKGGAILVANHRHLPDPGILGLTTERAVHYLAKKELHDGFFGPFFRAMLTIPVDRINGAHNSLETGEAVLKDGHLLGIYPEGTRNKIDPDEGLLPFKFGAVKMAQDTGAPIIPAIQTGGKIPFFDPYRVYVGLPVYIAQDEDLSEANDRLREIMLEMMKQVKPSAKK